MKITLGANIIFVSNLATSKEWYEKNLGMKTLEYRPPEFLEMSLGENIFYIETENPKRAEGFKEVKIGGMCSAILHVEDIKATIDKLKNNGVKIVVEPVQQFWGGCNAKIADPDGNIFTLDQDDSMKKKHISFDDFKKIEVKAGKILSAEKIPDTDKLLKLSVDFAELTPRQIVSGISTYFPDPALLVGKTCMFVTNLEPRMIRGFESNGMLFAVSTADGAFSLLEPNPTIPAGTLAK